MIVTQDLSLDKILPSHLRNRLNDSSRSFQYSACSLDTSLLDLASKEEDDDGDVSSSDEGSVVNFFKHGSKKIHRSLNSAKNEI